jgi:lysozyme family protein
MKNNFDLALSELLKHEGGYVNNPKDPGGMTNLGVTRAVWESYVGRESSEKEMRTLTPAQVAPLYKRKYWDAINGDSLPSGLDLCVFDCAVNSGVGRAAKMLQGILGLAQDGSIGPKTLEACNKFSSKDLVDKFCKARQDFLESLPTFKTFGKGWTARVAEVESKSTNLA